LLGRRERQWLQPGALAPDQHHRLHFVVVGGPGAADVGGAEAGVVVGAGDGVGALLGIVVGVLCSDFPPLAAFTLACQFGGAGTSVPLGTKAMVIHPFLGTRRVTGLAAIFPFDFTTTKPGLPSHLGSPFFHVWLRT